MPTPSSSSLACTVNGRAVTLDIAPHSLLLDVLRERLGLKGAKRSCDIQVCGACTVLVDGAPVSACTYLGVEVQGREIRTVEGLADGETLHAVQAAFVEHGAIQCGFCTSGMLLSAVALLEENPAPTREQILHYLRGNLCRCTGYQKIIDAIVACANPPPDLLSPRLAAAPLSSKCDPPPSTGERDSTAQPDLSHSTGKKDSTERSAQSNPLPQRGRGEEFEPRRCRRAAGVAVRAEGRSPEARAEQISGEARAESGEGAITNRGEPLRVVGRSVPRVD